MNSRKEARKYRSPLRKKQSEQTRQRILDAVIEKLAEEGLHEFSIASAAELAEVSERTVYRHFGSRQGLLDALEDRFNDRDGIEVPETPDALAQAPKKLFESFDRHEKLFRARLETEYGQEIRRRARTRRAEQVSDVLSGLTEHLGESGTRRVEAVFHYLLSSHTWWSMKEESGLDGEEAGKAVSWALQRLIDVLREGDSSIEGDS